MGIHNYDQQYELTQQMIQCAAISDQNKQLILAFVKDLILEGLSKPRLVKYMNHLYQIANALGKDMNTIKEEDIKQYVAKIQQSKYSAWTKRDYKIVLRRFYRWMEKKYNFPNIVGWVSIRISRSEQKLPSEGDLLTEKDIEKLLAAAEHPRDKALLSMLWESGTRIGELGNLKLKNVCFDGHGTVISVTGKTGSRKIRLMASTPYISTWMGIHPLKEEYNASLWINIGTKQHHNPMSYSCIRCLLRRMFRKAGIRKRFNPHLFRHSRATFMANHLTEFQMNQYFGWFQGSKMPATYVHMSGRDLDTAILTMNGFKTDQKKQESTILPKKCPRCDTINSYETIHCMKCGSILDLKYLMEVDEKRQKADTLMALFLRDKEVQDLLKQKIATGCFEV